MVSRGGLLAVVGPLLGAAEQQSFAPFSATDGCNPGAARLDDHDDDDDTGRDDLLGWAEYRKCCNLCASIYPCWFQVRDPGTKAWLKTTAVKCTHTFSSSCFF